ncbi:MAG: TetR/AcrR family transcriptional regulator [Acidimicrobiia bacterium]
MPPSTYDDPRIERTRTVVLAAAVDAISDLGFSGATIDAISRRSGVARSTIYRHWSTRSDLLLDAVRTLLDRVDLLESTELRSDLISIATFLSKSLTTEPTGTIVASLMAEARRDEEVAQLHQRFVTQRLETAARMIEAAIERGDLPPGTVPASMATDLAAPIFFKALAMRETPEPEWIESLVDRWIAAYVPDTTS